MERQPGEPFTKSMLTDTSKKPQNNLQKEKAKISLDLLLSKYNDKLFKNSAGLDPKAEVNAGKR